MPAPPNLPPEFIGEDDLIALGIDPEIVLMFCPWATELVGLDGKRCWAAEDIALLLESGAR
ncbi:MAG TPA: hypothetical protein VLM40_19950 [Gemmata sp.]|nr:hypothetical protein [Gemmata sp.]